MTEVSKISEDGNYNNIRKVFRLTPELQSIGSEVEYEKYINTIFPESVIKGILWHGSPNEKFDEFNADKVGQLDGGFFGVGFYFTPEWKLANNYRTRYRRTLGAKHAGEQGGLYPCMLNIKNIYKWKPRNMYGMTTANDIHQEDKQFTDEEEKEILDKYNKIYNTNYKELTRDNFEYADQLTGLMRVITDFLKESGYDGAVALNPVSKTTEYVIFESDQSYILGSQDDINRFREYKENNL